VIVFRLRPRSELTVDLPHVPVTPGQGLRVETVAVEEQYTERAFITPDREAYEPERGEAKLVLRCRDRLNRQGHKVSRLRIIPAGETAPSTPTSGTKRPATSLKLKGHDPRAAAIRHRSADRLQPLRRGEAAHRSAAK